jgi:hypothetical protein
LINPTSFCFLHVHQYTRSALFSASEFRFGIADLGHLLSLTRVWQCLDLSCLDDERKCFIATIPAAFRAAGHVAQLFFAPNLVFCFLAKHLLLHLASTIWSSNEYSLL